MKTTISIPNPSYNPDDDESPEEIELEVKFTYDPGYPATMTDDGERESIIVSDDVRNTIEEQDWAIRSKIVEQLIELGRAEYKASRYY